MLNHFCIGIGKEYIWLHDFLGCCLNLSPIARILDGKHYFLDARNHGDSFQAKGMDYKTQANDIVTFMNAHGIRKACVIGHGMGGKTAMALACLQPERVEKLCVLDSAPKKYMGVMDQYYGYERHYLRFIKNTDIEGKTRKEIESLCFEKFDNPRIVHLITSNLKGNDKSFTWRAGIDNITDGIEDIEGWDVSEGKYEGKIVAIVGGASIYTAKNPLLGENEPVAGLYKNYFPKAEIEILENVKHFIYTEASSQTKAAILKHLSYLGNK
ncbi:hypothetical protein SteCoe_9140 [Stentor coeruleus]|uniref:AB hydrolase-1 domain-containing protein n=1 Tax=Stentor coeruleus TaxID=5963 RepID=A0A1R2CIQ8_9CILI|nr:hypothetical protein SteCoe_9140 [Stentor coeruleus]